MCVWSVEADIFDFNDSDILEFVYSNNEVRRFLEAKNSMGLAACKGMGKTFLLKAKRMQMQGDNAVLFLPKNRLVDVSGTVSIDRMHMKFLSSYSNWTSVWLSCICIYILSLDNFSDIIDICEKQELPESVQSLLRREKDGIFNVLHIILNFKSKEKLNEIVQSSGILFDYVQRIQQSVVLFVDKLEEPFNRGYYTIPGDSRSAHGNYNSSIWAYAQLAFAEAVYILLSGRHHIKIFYSIRKEALYNGEEISVEYSKIRDRVVTLKYTPEDLYKMFSLYISKEKDSDLCYPEYAEKNPIKSLVGVDIIIHRSGVEENVWDYIYRHTFQRPRDIMEMCMAIHQNIIKNQTIRNATTTEQIRTLRHWINEISTMECQQYLSTLEPFMSQSDNIHFKEEIISFARQLPTNIFTNNSIKYYCHQINKREDMINCQECNQIHYFSTLYNIGLLGCIYESVNDKKYYNVIKHIGESKFDSRHPSLPKGAIYYMHPGFGNIIQEEREVNMLTYIPCRYIVNSFSNEIPASQIRFMNDAILSIMGNVKENSVFITSTNRDLRDIRQHLKSILELRGYEVVMYEEPEFPQMDNLEENMREGATHDHCIDEIMECKHLIYLFSGRFGGPYQGTKYQAYIEKHEDVIKIQPSISFMEYLVAKDNGKNVKVYVDEKVDITRGEYIANGKKDSYKSNIVENNDVYTQLGYFNELGNGTWYDFYNNLLNLEEYIYAHFPEIEK